MSKAEPEQVEIDCKVRVRTEKAWLIVTAGTGDVHEVENWIPLSQISDYSEEGGKVTGVFIARWLAEQRGLV